MDDEAELAETTGQLTVAVQVVFYGSVGYKNAIQVSQQEWQVLHHSPQCAEINVCFSLLLTT